MDWKRFAGSFRRQRWTSLSSSGGRPGTTSRGGGARIVVSRGEAVVEDLGSKNGTFVGDRRIGGPTPLADRDRLRLGRTVLVFRCARAPGSTETELP